MNSKQTLESILNTVSDPIFVKDRSHRWVVLNDACCQFIGHPREQLIGKSDYEFFPKKEADVFWEKDEIVFLSGKENVNEESFTDSAGATHTIVTKKKLLVDSQGEQYIVGVIRDMTELKRTSDALIHQVAELGKSEVERDHLELFAYVAAHDLREPLQRIVGFTDLLKKKFGGSMPEDATRYLQKVMDASERMGSLIDDLLRYSKIMKRSERFEKVDLNTVFESVRNDLDYLLEKNGVQVVCEKLPVVEGDASQLRQVFQNLISNAIKFSRDSKPPMIHVRCREDDRRYWEVMIEDNGIGFDAKQAEKIFKPFERLNSRDQYEGNGIGLAICQKIMTHHEGKIHANSAPQKGAVFYLYFPKSQ